ncbi:intersectin-2a [Chanos chanos]|uniref:Intersectin-2a n=1 Tax=Chanos chanos TaxID=29144 RepID=A0A6J2W5Z7_CHACN|nr:intersectin-2-like [Chanos chanos]
MDSSIRYKAVINGIILSLALSLSLSGGCSIWAITPEERGKHDKQFDSLNPTLGYVSGEQARNFFLQSGLPSPVLAQIWALADMGKDGKMDRLEFSIAMKLIKLQLQGQPLPSALPIIMKQTPTPMMTSSSRFGMGSMPNLTVMPTMPILTPVPIQSSVPAVPGLVPVGMPVPLLPSLSTPALPNGTASLLTPAPAPPLTSSGLSKSHSLLDLASSSSNSSSSTSLVSNSPKTGASDWAVPHASRLKYRQQFNSLDKLMSGYLSGPQVRNALTASNLTQTQLATIWNLADVDRDGQLRADEFILAMHLVDMAKCGHPLPLSLPPELVPPSLRALKSCDLLNGSMPLISTGHTDLIDPEPALRSKSNVAFEDKLRENFQRGSAELEKRRQALQEEQRREEERRRQKEREEQEQRERETREQEARRKQEEERRLERQREIDRQREEERLKELERLEAEKREYERQKKLEWECEQRAELQSRRERIQRDITLLTARKKTLEQELEAVGNRHRQISDCLRDAQSKKQVQRAELDLTNQKRDRRISEISALQIEFEDFEKKLSQLVPERQRLSDHLKNLSQSSTAAPAVSVMKNSVNEKGHSCRKLKEQLDALERETTVKLSEIDRYNRDLKSVEMDDYVLQGLLSLLGCLTNLFFLIKGLRERQSQQQAVLDKLNTVKEQKIKELQRRRKDEERKRREEEERRKREEEEEAARQAKLQQEEAERQRKLLQEREAQLREEQELQAQARLRQAQEEAAALERRREEERRREAERRRADEQKRMERERNAVSLHTESNCTEGVEPVLNAQGNSATLSTYRALYPFTARNADELTLDAGCLVQVDKSTVGEPGWLYGHYHGNTGWFPESYAEKYSLAENLTNTPKQALIPPGQSTTTTSSGIPHVNTDTPEHPLTLESSSDTHDSTHTERVQVVALCSWTAKMESHLNFSKDDIITVLEQQENWWLGELNGEQGWFPKTYVSVVTSSDTQTEPLYSTVDEYDGPDSSQTEEYVALYTYESPESGDLTFQAEDTIMVMEREGEWWRGCIGDQSGLFPSNYVKVKDTGAPNKKPEIAQVSTANVATTKEQLSLTPGQLIVILGKNSNGWWLGELQARGKRRQKGWFRSANVRLLEQGSGKTTPAPVPLCQVIAMYDYKAANDDEMSFLKGQLINVLNKDDPDWWKGELNGVTGLFPTNYVTQTTDSDPSQQCKSHLHPLLIHTLSFTSHLPTQGCADLVSLDSMSAQERRRQGYIHELIQTEERYVEDLELVLEVFHKPMSESGRLTEKEMGMIFVNWRELIMCNTKLLKALRVRKKTCGERAAVQMIGDILEAELSHMPAYIRFCSCQLNGAALLTQKTDQEPEFKLFLKKIASNYRCKGMPLSSFLLKPMQRITRYPLHIKNILENTPPGHVDEFHLRAALERAEELCSQVNEGVREKENSDRLEWIQNHVQCEGIIEHLVFNSLTNCLGPRKLLHSGRLHKSKSSKELWAFLFNDFLLLTYTSKQFSSGADKLFNPKSNTQFKMYKTPVFLNEVLVKMPSDPCSDDPVFHISHIDRVYTIKADTINERTTWVQRIKAASEHFIETEKKRREKAYQARSLKSSGIGRLLVTVQEATELKPCKPNGKSNPYCELTMGAQCYTSRPLSDTVNPKWNFSCQFFIKDLYQDVLCITIFERDQFSPDDFLGRTEVPVATIKRDQESKGAATRRLLLHEVPTGEVTVRLDLQLYDQTPLH